MPRLKDDLTNKKYNRLTAIKYNHQKGYKAFWLFRCDCGKEKVIQASSVTRGLTKSCGCLAKEIASKNGTLRKGTIPHNRLPNNQGFWNNVYQKYRGSAKKRNYYFDLTVDEVKELCLGECYYCHRQASEDDRNGIDRVDNEQGYTIDNVVSCCKQCNVAKMDRSAPDFINLCVRVAKIHG